MAKKFACRAGSFGAQPIEHYEPGARDTALSQATLAAQRLANMLNEAFQIGHR